LCGECKLDSFSLESLHHLKIDLLVDLVKKPVIGRIYPVRHIDIERGVIEIAEVNPGKVFGVGIYLGDFFEDLLYDFDGFFSLFVA
jgi:hypothetical protein